MYKHIKYLNIKGLFFNIKLSFCGFKFKMLHFWYTPLYFPKNTFSKGEIYGEKIPYNGDIVDKYRILQDVLQKRISLKEASPLLGLGYKQTIRLKNDSFKKVLKGSEASRKCFFIEAVCMFLRIIFKEEISLFLHDEM